MAVELWNVPTQEGRDQAPQIDPTNYATRDEVRQKVRNELLPLMQQVRSQRAPIEQLWNRFYDVWAGKRTVKLYVGRSNLFIPIGRKIIETFVANLRSQIFPTNETFDVEPRANDPEAMMAADNIKSLLLHDIEQAQVERFLDLFVRQGLIYGSSPVKIFWKTQTAKGFKLQPRLDTSMAQILPGLQGGEFEETKLRLYEGPTFHPVNLLRWYVHPITARTTEDARLIFEDMDVDWNHIVEMKRAGKYTNIEGIRRRNAPKDESGTSEIDSNRNLRLQSYGISIDQIKEDQMPRTQFRLTEIWCKFDLRGNGEEVPCQIVTVDGEVLMVRQNPFLDQQAPYLTWKFIDVPDHYYGQGMLEQIEHQQYAMNALINQAIDSVTFQTNHILGVDVSRVAQDPSSLAIRPRAIWRSMGNPNEVFAIYRPPDTSQAAFATANLLSGAMQDTAGAPPILQGKLGSKEITATETQALMAGATSGLTNAVRNLSTMVMARLLMKYFRLEQQYRSMEDMADLMNGFPLQVAPNDLLLDAMFRWRTAEMVSATIQAQQVMNAKGETELQAQQLEAMAGASQQALGQQTSPEAALALMGGGGGNVGPGGLGG